jgi:hypothetical protein
VDLEQRFTALADHLVAVGGGAHIFLILGTSEELRRTITHDVVHQQFRSLLPTGVQLLPYDTLLRLFEQRLPPKVHILVPDTQNPVLDPSRDRLGQLPLVYISHSFRDGTFVDRLQDALNGVGVRTWRAPSDSSAYDHADDQVETAIRLGSVAILVLSRSSIDNNRLESQWPILPSKEAP